MECKRGARQRCPNMNKDDHDITKCAPGGLTFSARTHAASVRICASETTSRICWSASTSAVDWTTWCTFSISLMDNNFSTCARRGPGAARSCDECPERTTQQESSCKRSNRARQLACLPPNTDEMPVLHTRAETDNLNADGFARSVCAQQPSRETQQVSRIAQLHLATKKLPCQVKLVNLQVT